MPAHYSNRHVEQLSQRAKNEIVKLEELHARLPKEIKPGYCQKCGEVRLSKVDRGGVCMFCREKRRKLPNG